MTHDDAVAFLAHAGPFRGTWADVGAGTGTFSRALAQLLGAGGVVLAMDTNERALAQLRRGGSPDAHALIHTILGDMHDLAAIDATPDAAFNGLLFANVLHFTRRVSDVLADAAARLKPDGRVVVIEYERRMPNPWVPHPLPLGKLADVAKRAGLGAPREVARRASSYHREMYCAVLASPRV